MDDDDDDAQDSTMENANQNESNVGKASDLFDEDGVPELDATLSPWT